MIPTVLLIIEDIAPSQYITYYPLLMLHKQHKIYLDVNLESCIHNNDYLDHFDSIIFSRNHSKKTVEIINHLKEMGTPYIFEIDDDLFQYQIDYPEENTKSQASLERLTYVIKEASAVRVFSNQMKDRVRCLTPDCHLVVPPLYWSMINNSKSHSEKVRITYATSRIEGDPLFKIILEALRIIHKRFYESIEIVFWGYIPEDFKKAKNVRFFPFQRNYEGFIKKFSSFSSDIGLAPMSDNLFCQAKTNNKFREYGACKIAGIYSDVELYKDVQHGFTGFLVRNTTSDWVDALAQMVQDKDLRHSISENAYNYVRKKYSEAVYVQEWGKDIFDAITKNRVNSFNQIIQPFSFSVTESETGTNWNQFKKVFEPPKLLEHSNWILKKVKNYFLNRIELIRLKLKIRKK